MKYVVFYMCRTIKILISNWPRKLKFSQSLQAGKTCQLLLTFLTKVTLWSRCTSNFYALIGQDLTGEFMRKIYAACILKLVYFDSWSWQSFVSTCDVFSRLFLLDVQEMKFSCYQESSVIRGQFVFWVFGWEIRRLVKVGNTIWDGIVFVFNLAWSVRELKSLRRYWPYLIASRSCILNGKPE